MGCLPIAQAAFTEAHEQFMYVVRIFADRQLMHRGHSFLRAPFFAQGPIVEFAPANSPYGMTHGLVATAMRAHGTKRCTWLGAGTSWWDPAAVKVSAPKESMRPVQLASVQVQR